MAVSSGSPAAICIAALVSASFARAESTTLAYTYEASNKDQLATDIRASKSNRERGEMFMKRLTGG